MDFVYRSVEGFFKLNVDGVADLATSSGRAGAIVRDHHGNLVGAVAMRALILASILAIELYALKIGIRSATSGVATLPPFYVSRSANGAAHRIARFSLCDNGLSF
ncbi:PREDICTED: PRUPE_7G038400 [Prunus dulcis]|uniref:PREDICTED: PRUPE_7G038400 n=1 Tax=Prunus dulcis TaxID=3755 RepID=A0A5E4G837_PRUDU|nr:hypothetical protein L3X38_002145 [Prunus dulcis]VVA35896.1 PREDICTED: PRUPE_7G038400 [Prunus dulcis]